MPLLIRLLKEFSLPALIAVGWTAYSVSEAPGPWDLRSLVTYFAPSFFLVSWATGQFFRVQKQAAVEKNFAGLEQRVGALVDRLEQHSKDFIGHATGADSIAYFHPRRPSDGAIISGGQVVSGNYISFSLINPSDYPVFDVSAEFLDLDQVIDPSKGEFWTRHEYKLEYLYPKKAIVDAIRIRCTNADRVNIQVFIRTRTKKISQQFRMVREGAKLYMAFKTSCDGETVELQLPEDFPGLTLANRESFFG